MRRVGYPDEPSVRIDYLTGMIGSTISTTPDPTVFEIWCYSGQCLVAKDPRAYVELRCSSPARPTAGERGLNVTGFDVGSGGGDPGQPESHGSTAKHSELGSDGSLRAPEVECICC